MFKGEDLEKNVKIDNILKNLILVLWSGQEYLRISAKKKLKILFIYQDINNCFRHGIIESP